MPLRRGKFGIEFRGLRELAGRLRVDGEVGRRVERAATRAMIEVTEDLLGRSMRDAPLDEGTLRASGHAAVYVDGKAVARSGSREAAGRPEAPEIPGQTIVEGGAPGAVVGEVGFNTPYALVQHERLDFEHPKGGKAKYLESHLTEQAHRYADHLGDAIGRALR